MIVREFSLLPFPGEENAADLEIAGAIVRRTERLSIRCALRGDLSKIKIPAPKQRPERKDRLWEETCVELFLGETDSERYWEFNLSPSGDWNVYRFASSRKGMQEEPAFTSLAFGVRSEPESLLLSLELDIGKIVPAGNGVDAAVSAVVKTAMSRISHWALTHPGPRPDFHRRDGFRLNLPGACRPDSRS